ncbi:MAG: YwaF family protein [Metamycoplasmataceae bacterium]
MINDVHILTETLTPPDGHSFFGLSFLSWQGNQVTYADSWTVVLVINLLVIFSCLFMFLSKDLLHARYQNNSLGVIRATQGFAIFIILLSIFRITILSIGGYPNLWEVIPLHFCRLFVLLVGTSLAFRKIEYVKYFAVFSILGGIVGLSIPDLSNSEYWSQFGGMDIGYDNYIFWDYFIIHGSSVVLPFFIMSCLKPVFYKKEIMYSLLVMGGVAVAIFLLDLALSNVPDERWRPNWFYFGVPAVNGIQELLSFMGPLVDYPTLLFTFIVIGIIMYTSATFIYMNSDRIQFTWYKDHRWHYSLKAKIVPSENMNQFKHGPLYGS